MNYKQQLDFAKTNKIDPIALQVANEVECTFERELSEEDFETICSLIERAYLKSEGVEVWSIVKAINDLLEEKTIGDLKEMSIWDIISAASYYF